MVPDKLLFERSNSWRLFIAVIDAGIFPLRLFPLRDSTDKLLRLANVPGILPLMMLLPAWKFCSSVLRFPNEGGSLPMNALFDMPMKIRPLHLDNAARKSRFPESWFSSTKMRLRFSKLLNDIGTDPVNRFPNKSICVRLDRLPIASGMAPVI
ncbi:hypothetical protein BS78_03G241600 [Paspalum vaginatum]|nr:hypothetical protein BS78_03G241600 [Paspalum vaginatum]